MNVLQFSGGIDSLACLLLMQHEPKLCVLTVLTDGVYASTVEYLNQVEKAFPDIVFERVHAERNLAGYGHPVDVVPLRWTAMGQSARGGVDVRYQDTYACCNRGIWEPLDRTSRWLGATTIYRGQRNDDRLRAPVNDGFVDRGVTLRFPIADWSRERVVQFVKAQAAHLMPPGYAEGEKTSRDCWDCTTYLQDNGVRIAALPAPQFKHVNGLIARWRDDVLTEMETAT